VGGTETWRLAAREINGRAAAARSAERRIVGEWDEMDVVLVVVE
jgi:hypothetical protein